MPVTHYLKRERKRDRLKPQTPAERLTFFRALAARGHATIETLP